MTGRIDLVADLGESFGPYRLGDDSALLDIVTSANVACGFHAGDPRVMDATVAACANRSVAVGAHPGFPDLVGFGRRTMELTPDEVRTDTIYQLGALAGFAAAHAVPIRHLAPHGRLGNLVATRRDYAEAVVAAVRAVDPDLIVLAQDGELAETARTAGLAVAIVGIADRAYRDDGTLVPRSEPGAVLHDEDAIAARTLRMVRDGLITTTGGRDLPVRCDTVLLHGDTAGSIQVARRIRTELEDAGVECTAPDPSELRPSDSER